MEKTRSREIWVECLTFTNCPSTSTISAEPHVTTKVKPCGLRWCTHKDTIAIECSITTNFQVSEVITENILLSLSVTVILSFVAFLMSLPHIHSTSAASVASAGFESAGEGSTAGTLEASWRVRTERSYVGSQDDVGDHKHLIKKKNIWIFHQSTNAI